MLDRKRRFATRCARCDNPPMITLYSYPELFGVADNNPYGLKTFAFLKLSRLPFQHEHIFDAKAAPRAQLPYLKDDDHEVGDSDAIVAYLTQKYALSLDSKLTPAQRTTEHFIRRTLDDLYWVMSYSRWSDAEFWPIFKSEMLRTHPILTDAGMEAARKYNFERYYYQGIGRYEREQVYARGLADLGAISSSMPREGFFFGAEPSTVDASVYGFLANIFFYPIDTPLKRFVSSDEGLVRHCRSVHSHVS